MNRQSDRLPQGWKWVRLGDVCEVILGQSPPSSTYRKIPEGLPFFQGKADFGDISPNPTTWCVEPKKVAEPGDILISVRAPVGPTNIANTRCCIGRGLAALRCRNEADRDFVLAGLKLYESDISGMGTGSLFNAITGKQLKEFVFPLPPLPEQKRIAALLNQQMAYVEKARKAAEEMLEAAQALPGAFLRQAFPAHGDALPAGWKLRCLCDLCTYDRKTVTPSNPLAQTLAYIGLENVESNSGRIMLNTGDSSSGQVKGNSYRFDARHVLYGKLRPYLNKVVLPEFSGRCSTELIPLLPGPIDREYLAWYLRRPETVYYAMRSKTGSRMPRTDMKAFMQMPVLLPPLPEQKRIAALLKEQMAYVETVRMSAREQLDAINALPAALLRRAFAGTL